MKKFTIDELNFLVSPDYFQPCQFMVLRFKLRGYTQSQIAEELDISVDTVRSRMYELRQILGLPCRNYSNKEWFDWAIENGLMEVRI